MLLFTLVPLDHAPAGFTSKPSDCSVHREEVQAWSYYGPDLNGRGMAGPTGRVSQLSIQSRMRQDGTDGGMSHLNCGNGRAAATGQGAGNQVPRFVDSILKCLLPSLSQQMRLVPSKEQGEGIP